MADLDLTNFQGFLDYEGLNYFKEKNDNLTDEKIEVETERATNAEETLTTNLNTHTSNKSNPHGVTKSQVGLGNVDNTSDVNKPISTATQTALDKKANIASPTLTGIPKAPTATSGTNTTQIATTAFVQTAIGNLINGAPETANTLKELSDLIEEHQDVTDALNAAIGTKANASDLTSHTGNTTVHITSTERTSWNDANSKKHTHSNKTILDETTASFTSAEKEKLAGIASGANKYSLPSAGSSLGGVKTGGDVTISSGVITVNDDSHNHVISNVDGLQSALDGKVPTTRTVNGKALSANITLSASDVGADASGSASNALASAKEYADSVGQTVKNDLLNGAGAAYDTLGELGALINDNQDAIEALETVAAGKQPTITGGATTIASSNLTANRALISNSSGKVAVSAVTSTELEYLDGVTSNIQTQLDGKAPTSHGTHVTYGTTTPKVAGTGAVGTEIGLARIDHVHPAQTTVSGNSGSTTKLATARTIDGVSFNGTAAITHYGTCSTAAGTAAKTVALTGFSLVTGARVLVKFTVTNTASSPTLNVNSTGAKAIMYRGSAISAGYLAANRVYEFVYDGTDWEFVGDINTDSNTTYSQATSSKLGLVKIGYTESGKNYPVELNDSGQMFVNVPWTDNNTVYTHPSYTAKSSGFYKVTVDATGHVSGTTAVTKADITGLGIPSSDTTYSAFVKSGSGAKAGLVPAPSTTAGSTKYLCENGTWAVPATSYTLPTASSTLGGVKTTSTVTSTSGLTACPIINGVVYYKDTSTTYTHPTSGVTAGTYRSVTVDANGHVTAGSNPTITVAQGGTGKTTLTSGYALIGNGTSAVSLRAITSTPSSGSTSLFTAGGAYTQLATKLNTSAVVTSLDSTSTTNALAASAGKNLQDQITALNSDFAYIYGTSTSTQQIFSYPAGFDMSNTCIIGVRIQTQYGSIVDNDYSESYKLEIALVSNGILVQNAASNTLDRNFVVFLCKWK